MAHELQIVPGRFPTELYDKDTGKICIPEKVVDITADFLADPGEKRRACLIFTRDSHRQIVIIRLGMIEDSLQSIMIFFKLDKSNLDLSKEEKLSCFGPIGETGKNREKLEELISRHSPMQ